MSSGDSSPDRTLPKYANVYFLRKKQFKNIKIITISEDREGEKMITPQADDDFESDKVYFAEYFSCGSDGDPCDNEEHDHVYRNSRCTIYFLGGNKYVEIFFIQLLLLLL